MDYYSKCYTPHFKALLLVNAINLIINVIIIYLKWKSYYNYFEFKHQNIRKLLWNLDMIKKEKNNF